MADNAAGGSSAQWLRRAGAGLRTAVEPQGIGSGRESSADGAKSGALPAQPPMPGRQHRPCATAGTSSSKPSGLGATTVFGIPGQHALGLFDAVQVRAALRLLPGGEQLGVRRRRVLPGTGEVGVLFLSTGPGALTSLAGLQEAYATGVPMVVIASQIPLEGLGARRKGMLHQLDDQKASAANVTKSQR